MQSKMRPMQRSVHSNRDVPTRLLPGISTGTAAEGGETRPARRHRPPRQRTRASQHGAAPLRALPGAQRCRALQNQIGLLTTNGFVERFHGPVLARTLQVVSGTRLPMRNDEAHFVVDTRNDSDRQAALDCAPYLDDLHNISRTKNREKYCNHPQDWQRRVR